MPTARKTLLFIVTGELISTVEVDRVMILSVVVVPLQGAFDVTLPVKLVAARFKQGAELQIAYRALKGSAQARLRAMRRCNESY